jgi:superfamily I DNA/RNA helicase
MSTDNSEQQEHVLRDVYTRLKLEIPEEGLLPQQVRIMTMHGAKGLEADVVIIPGLEEDILPGAKRSKYPGLIQEAARQLYVSITRARHSVILTYAESRIKHGTRDFGRRASRYCDHLNGRFIDRKTGLSDVEAQTVIQTKELFSKNMSERQIDLG